MGTSVRIKCRTDTKFLIYGEVVICSYIIKLSLSGVIDIK